MEKIIYEKKNFTIYHSCTISIVVWPSFVVPFQLPWLRRSNYDWKKKDTVVCPLLRHSNYGRKKKRCTIVITTGKKNVLVVCLAGVRLLLRPEKKKFYSSVWRVRDHHYDRKKKLLLSVWRVRDHYYDRKKRSSSCLSGGCAIVIMTKKKKF